MDLAQGRALADYLIQYRQADKRALAKPPHPIPRTHEGEAPWRVGCHAFGRLRP